MRFYNWVTVILFFSWACGSHDSSFMKVKTLKTLSVGDTIKPFTAYSINGLKITEKKPDADFTVICINKALPPFCFNNESNLPIETIIANNGRLIAGSDGKFAHLFDVETKVVNGEFSLDNSVVLFVDRNLQIKSIYEKVDLEKIAEIFQNELKNEHSH